MPEPKNAPDFDVESHLNHFDQQVVQFQFIDDPTSIPGHVFFAVFGPISSSSSASDRDDLVRMIDEALTEDRVPFVLKIQRNYYDWGASAAGQDILVEVANHLLAEGISTVVEGAKIAMGFGLKALWDRWRSHPIVSREKSVLPDPDIAEGRARERISEAFDIDEGDLTVVSQAWEQGVSEWQLEFEGKDNFFQIVMRCHENEMLTGKIARRSDSTGKTAGLS